jgi:hypothetical protein
VEGGGRQATKGVSERFGGQGVEFAQFPAMDEFGKKRACGNGGGATAAEETGCVDAIVFQDRSELQDVATNGIADLDVGGGGGEFTDIARVLEMVEESITEHMGKYPSEQSEVSSGTLLKLKMEIPKRECRRADIVRV